MVSSSCGGCQTPPSVLLGPPDLHLAFSASLLSAQGLATPSTAVCHSWLGLIHQQPDLGSDALPGCVLWVRERRPRSPACPPLLRPTAPLELSAQTATVAAQPAEVGAQAHAPAWPAGAPVCLPQVLENPLQKRLRWERPKQNKNISQID